MKTQVFILTLLAVIAGAADDGLVAGFAATDRKYLDSWSNTMYIPNVQATLRDGIVSEYRMYARRAGKIILQVWRHESGTSYNLVSQTTFIVPSSGMHTVHPEEIVTVKAGDVLGFYFPGDSIIPFDGKKCTDNRGLYVRRPILTSVVPGKSFKFSSLQWKPCREYAFNALVLAGEFKTAGFASQDRRFLDEWSNAMYIPNANKPLPEGFVTSYSLYARKTGTIVLQVWRHVTASTFMLVDQTRHLVSETGVNTVQPDELVSIEKGDVLGFYFPGNSIIPFDGRECANELGLYVQKPSPASVTRGKHFKFSNMEAGWNPCRQYSFSADVLDIE